MKKFGRFLLWWLAYTVTFAALIAFASYLLHAIPNAIPGQRVADAGASAAYTAFGGVLAGTIYAIYPAFSIVRYKPLLSVPYILIAIVNLPAIFFGISPCFPFAEYCPHKDPAWMIYATIPAYMMVVYVLWRLTQKKIATNIAKGAVS